MEQNANPQGSSKGLSIAALVCGVLGIVTYFISIGSVSGIQENGEGVVGTISALSWASSASSSAPSA